MFRNICAVKREQVGCRVSAFYDRPDALGPCLQRTAHWFKMLRMVVVLTDNRPRRVIENSLDDFVGDAHIAETGGERSPEIVGPDVGRADLATQSQHCTGG